MDRREYANRCYLAGIRKHIQQLGGVDDETRGKFKNPYDIIIEKGALKGVGQWVKSLWEPQKIALITDNHVGGLYAEKVKLSLEHEGFEVVVFNFLEGEASKNLKTVNKAYEF